MGSTPARRAPVKQISEYILEKNSALQNGGCSSTAEHLVVVQAVAGSIPVNHPHEYL